MSGYTFFEEVAKQNPNGRIAVAGHLNIEGEWISVEANQANGGGKDEGCARKE
ncbi:hypothetical protein MJA45_15030 [Paenibacillus aurantius]|uniref:Uncharacterized protein n=1 Tax=Paenibacillus aurantius TaxID=2918900 RepID=A0AA96L9E5_9BACL|nr:hypothetical protein [Paenibacillus aurantius]WNQ08963.1 hypothetical protein MJA45_15030 [Paenibacillus aurantius]